MIFVTGALKELAGSIALMALLAVAYGAVVRTAGRMSRARITLGLLFGGAAMLAMQDRIPVADGVFVDLRHLPIALAGAFLGGQGALVAMAVALAMRIGIGGAGALAGSASIVIAGAAGLLWHAWTRGEPRRDVRAMLGLALLTSTYPAGALFLPASLIHDVLTVTLTAMVPLHVVGILVVGPLIERERILHATERLLLRDAHHDALTGLLNRRGFERAVARLPQRGIGALLLLDLDHFKRVNDVHGHPAGDAVLRSMSGRLSPVLDPGSLLARLGGEELAVFLPGQDPDDARRTAQRLCHAIRAEPFALPGGGRVAVTASVGGAWGSSAALEVLTARADAALYAAKHAGRDRCRFAAEQPTLADGIASATESACADCSLHEACCAERRQEAGTPPLRAARALA